MNTEGGVLQIIYDPETEGFHFNCPQMTCIFNVDGPENNYTNWTRFNNSIRNGGKDQILFQQGDDECSEIYLENGTVNFFLANGKGRANIRLYALTCLIPFEQHAETIKEK